MSRSSPHHGSNEECPTAPNGEVDFVAPHSSAEVSISAEPQEELLSASILIRALAKQPRLLLVQCGGLSISPRAVDSKGVDRTENV